MSMLPISDWWFDTERARFLSAARYYTVTASMQPWARSLYVATMTCSRDTFSCPWCGSPLLSSKIQDCLMCFRHGPITAEFLEDYGHLDATDSLIELRARHAHDDIASLADIAAMRADAALGPCRLPTLQSTAVEMVRGMRARRKGLVPWP